MPTMSASAAAAERDQPAQVRLQALPDPVDGLLLGREDPGRRRQPADDQQVHVQQREEHQPEDQAEHELRPQDRPEDAGELDLAEPQQVDVEARHHRESDEQEDEDADHDDRPPAGVRRHAHAAHHRRCSFPPQRSASAAGAKPNACRSERRRRPRPRSHRRLDPLPAELLQRVEGLLERRDRDQPHLSRVDTLRARPCRPRGRGTRWRRLAGRRRPCPRSRRSARPGRGCRWSPSPRS